MRTSSLGGFSHAIMFMLMLGGKEERHAET
jgi:hypothetical protein